MNKMKLMCRESYLNEKQSKIFTSSSMIKSVAFNEDTQGEKAHNMSILEIRVPEVLKPYRIYDSVEWQR